MTGVRRGVFGGLALAAALAAAGCGSGGGKAAAAGAKAAARPASPGSVRGAIRAAAAKTERAGALVDIRIVLRKPGVPKALAYGATGTVVERGGRLRIDRTQLGGNVQDEIFLRRGADDLVLYTTPSPVALPRGKTWLKVDLAKAGKQRYGANTTFLAGADQDPLQAVRLLASPPAKLRDLGRDTLPDHRRARHYRGTVDVVAAAKAAGVRGKGLTNLRQDMGTPTQSIDVWVDAQGRLARIRVKTPEKAPDGSNLRVQRTTDFRAYGATARVTAPPAAQVEDFFALNGK